MSHALGARHGVAHGMGNAILLPHVMRFNAGRPEGAKHLKDVAVALGLAAPADPVEAANAAADKVSELLVATGHPVKLAEVKVPKDDLEATGADPPRRVPAWLGRLLIGEAGLSVMTRARLVDETAKHVLGWFPRYSSWRGGFQHELARTAEPRGSRLRVARALSR